MAIAAIMPLGKSAAAADIHRGRREIAEREVSRRIQGSGVNMLASRKTTHRPSGSFCRTVSVYPDRRMGEPPDDGVITTCK